MECVTVYRVVTILCVHHCLSSTIGHSYCYFSISILTHSCNMIYLSLEYHYIMIYHAKSQYITLHVLLTTCPTSRVFKCSIRSYWWHSTCLTPGTGNATPWSSTVGGGGREVKDLVGTGSFHVSSLPDLRMSDSAENKNNSIIIVPVFFCLPSSRELIHVNSK